MGYTQVTANQQARSITISGERFQPTVGEEGTKATTNLRRQLGKFSYTVDLPKDADPQLISAKYAQHTLITLFESLLSQCCATH